MSLHGRYSEYPREFRKNNIRKDKELRIRRKKKRRKIAITVISILLVLLISAGSFIAYKWKKGRDLLFENTVSIDSENIDKAFSDEKYKPVLSDFGSTIEYNGKTYKYNPNVVSVAFIGIDKSEFGLRGEAVGTGGQADVIVVAAYDTVAEIVKFLVVPRDLMVDVNLYDIEGGYVGVKNTQICLSYAYGDGKDLSCRNVIDSIGRVMFNIPIKYYVSMQLDGISSLNDAVGGVTLKSIETFEDFEKGKTYTLWGRNAEAYVRSRNIELLDSDSYRRARQKQYFKAFADKIISNTKSDITFLGKFYKEASKYTVTNISSDEAVYLASLAITSNIALDDFTTVPGDYFKGEQYAEFQADYAALFETVLDIYYTEQ